jgi:integral membrane protein
MRNPLSLLRIIGDLEGVSYLLLLGVAMPLKYKAGIPQAVTWVGSLHGALFVAFCAALLQVHVTRRWSLTRTLSAFLSSLIPFGTFLLSRALRREEALEKPVTDTNTSSTH